MKKSILAAAAASLLAMMGPAQAATLGGMFKVTAVNVKPVNEAQSNATDAAFMAAQSMIGAATSTFKYKGKLNFGTYNTNGGNSPTTISGWLASAGGSVIGLDPTFGALQQSKGDIYSGTATTTFYLFERLARLGAGEFTIKHDDGIEVYDNGARIGGYSTPTSVITTGVNGFDGGKFSILYVATNSDPSVLNVDADVAPVPLPAALPLLAAGLGGLALMRRRRKSA